MLFQFMTLHSIFRRRRGKISPNENNCLLTETLEPVAYCFKEKNGNKFHIYIQPYDYIKIFMRIFFSIFLATGRVSLSVCAFQLFKIVKSDQIYCHFNNLIRILGNNVKFQSLAEMTTFSIVCHAALVVEFFVKSSLLLVVTILFFVRSLFVACVISFFAQA